MKHNFLLTLLLLLGPLGPVAGPGQPRAGQAGPCPVRRAATGPSARALATVLEPTRDAVLAGAISTGHAQAIAAAMTTLTCCAAPTTGTSTPTT